MLTKTRRWMTLAACLTVTGAAIGLTVLPGLLAAQKQGADQPAAKESTPEKAVQLPIGQVVLFSSGVGFFQREGSVEGDARIDLSFPTTDINDLLKSMVLRDLDGGAISTVSYDSNAPIDRTLRSFAVNLTGTPTFADILHQTRGEKVEVALANAGAGTLSGTIVGVEKTKITTPNKDLIEQATLNLWCSDGMRNVKLNEVQRVRFLNPALESEIRKALETLALSHDTQKKAVSIRCVGEGKRRVKVGYVVENPIWKTSYRLVLGSKAEEKPYLQGWAVVENTSDEDWKDVRMSLVSGRPISFQMDLYQPLFVRRPVVVPDLFEGLNPVAYSGSLDEISPPAATAGLGGMPADDAKAEKSAAFGAFSEAKRKAVSQRDGLAPSAKGDAAYADRLKRELKESLDLGQSVTASATATKLGDFFQYAIDRPVSLNRQKSALLPIVGKDVEASRVSIYNERVQTKHPLLGLRVKNTSGLHLMQGPITVFEGSTYAGDARVQDLQPDETRLVSYAIDLGTEVNPVPSSDSGRIVNIKAVKGIIETKVKNRQTKTYTVKNRNDQERVVLVEHPVNTAFTLVGDKPKETASDVYRFEVKVPAGQTKNLVVHEEREDLNSYAINTQGDDQIRWFVSNVTMSDKMKAGLTKAMELRTTLAKTQREIGEMQRQLRTIEEDQKRLRANLKEVSKEEKVYQRYIEKLDQQETQIEKYQADIKRLQTAEHEQKKAFEDYLAAFSAD